LDGLLNFNLVTFALKKAILNPIRQLAGQTAIYGLSSIVGRLLNYLLVPLYTRVLITSDYGIYTEMYAWVSILWVLLTYGMETTFFRFAGQRKETDIVFSTSFISLIASSGLFLLLTLAYAGNIADWMGYADRVHYVIYFALILSFDAIAAIPFARLRQENRPLKFAFIKLVNIGINIGLNLFFILLCPYLISAFPESGITRLIELFFNQNDLVGYIFISNLIATTVTLVLLIPHFSVSRFVFDTALWKSMLRYAWPLMIVAIAGSINLSLDKILLTMLLPGNSTDEIMSQVGIYGACYKVSIIMILFVQTFRYAADPFFFAEASKKDARQTYAAVLNFFTIIAAIIFLATTLYLDIVIRFIGASYREGRDVIPVLLMGNLFLGIYFNLSFWYKLTDKTIFGAIFSVIGAGVTIALNIILIPVYGYAGSAWAAFFAYFTMMVMSYLAGRKYYPIPYNPGKIILWVGSAALIFLVSRKLAVAAPNFTLLINSGLLLLFLGMVWIVEGKNILAVFQRN
jgi:O-antigen/teichoic acid export membrane protein